MSFKNGGNGFWSKKGYFGILMAVIAIGVFGVFLFTSNVTAHGDLFNDGFESEDFSSWDSADEKWEVSSTNAHSGSEKAVVKGNTSPSEDILLKSLSTEGHENITVSFYYKTDSLEEDDDDYVAFEWSADGGDSWETEYVINSDNMSSDWIGEAVAIELPDDANDNPDFQFHFIAHLNAGNDRVDIDDVSVTAEDDGLGKISGYKWEDLDGDGIKDEGEPAINDWTIWLDGDSYAVTGDDEKGWPDGYYEFDDLESDDYVVCEENQPSELDGGSWTQTYPSNDIDEEDPYYNYVIDWCDDEFEVSESLAKYGYEIDIDEDNAENVNFGNFEYGYISGHKYSEETNEPLSDWTIYLINENGSVNNTGTDEDGYYTFEELGPGTYQVCEATTEDDETGDEVCTTHERQTYPEEFYTVEMTSGAENQDYNFKNFTTGSVRAFKFKDLNLSGSYDEDEENGESPVEGWNMCLYKSTSWEGEEGEGSGGDDWELVDGECKDTDETGWAVWNGLDLGLYRLDEENRTGWTHTTDNSYEFELDEDDLVYTRKFGNVPNELEVIKFYDVNGNGEQEENEELLSGWEFCLYRVVWPGGEESGPVYEPAFENEDNFCRKTNENGSIVWSELEEGDYLIDEEERENWFHTNVGEDGRMEVEVEEGKVTERFGNVRNAIKIIKFWDQNQNGERDGYWTEEEDSEFIYTESVLENWEFCLYRWNSETEDWDLVECRDADEDGLISWMDLEEGTYKVVETVKEGWSPTNFEGGTWEWIEIENGNGEQIAYFGNDTTSVDGHKFYDINQNGEQDYWAENLLEPDMRGWRICLYRWLPGEEESGEWVLVDCKDTDDDGLVRWTGLSPDLYKFEEDIRAELGWSPKTDSSYVFELGYLDNQDFNFGNWIEDPNPPVSEFDQPMEHEVIDTEMVSLELAGHSVDQQSGTQKATMSVHQLGGPESVQNYPTESFFDVFTELECPIGRSAEPSPSPNPSLSPTPSPIPSPIPIEIIALNLTSVNPITVSWSHDWAPPSSGVYCFETKATDYAGNVENTAWAGPLAYVPVAQINNEEAAETTETSFTVEWTTDKPATSRVIYDTVSHPTLGEAPNYGYAFSTAEEDLDPKVIEHSVVVSGLSAGTTYYYRTVSAASPESVGNENSTSTSSQQSSSGGGGGGSMGVIIDGPGASPTSTPSTISGGSTPTPTSSPNQSSVAGTTTGSVDSGSGSSAATSGNETGSESSSLGEPNGEPNKKDVILTGDSNQIDTSPTVNTEETSEENQEESKNSSFVASIGGLLGSVSLWWFLVLAIVVVIGVYAGRRKKME